MELKKETGCISHRKSGWRSGNTFGITSLSHPKTKKGIPSAARKGRLNYMHAYKTHWYEITRVIYTGRYTTFISQLVPYKPAHLSLRHWAFVFPFKDRRSIGFPDGSSFFTPICPKRTLSENRKLTGISLRRWYGPFPHRRPPASPPVPPRTYIPLPSPPEWQEPDASYLLRKRSEFRF